MRTKTNDLLYSPKCPKCGNSLLLRNFKEFMSNENNYNFYCPCCKIYGSTASTIEKAAEEFKELAKQYIPLEAGADLNELTEGRYYVDARNAVPQPFYSDPEECKKACELLRAAGYNTVTNGNIILVQPKAKEGQT